jgi:hypothetical protein
VISLLFHSYSYPDFQTVVAEYTKALIFESSLQGMRLFTLMFEAIFLGEEYCVFGINLLIRGL